MHKRGSLCSGTHRSTRDHQHSSPSALQLQALFCSPAPGSVPRLLPAPWPTSPPPPPALLGCSWSPRCCCSCCCLGVIALQVRSSLWGPLERWGSVNSQSRGGLTNLTPLLPTGAPLASELRCQCLHTMQGIHLKNIQSVKVMAPGPHCVHTEVIATLKNGHEACLNPEAPMVKKIIQKMLSKGSTN
ncbi:uncharacterized protein RHO17_015605 isoform 1-T1 [Thomomys bottae]